MKIPENVFPQDLYHSYIVEGERDATCEALRAFLEDRGYISHDSPDVLCQTYDTLAIGDNALIQEWHNNKNISDKKKICILATRFISWEAEHALLKILEEPKENTHFFLIVPDASLVLDTIRSRAHTVKIEGAHSSSGDAKRFLLLKPSERIEMIAQLISKNKSNDTSSVLRYEAISLINDIEQEIYRKFLAHKTDGDVHFSLTELEKARQYMKTPGASVKMILEHLALVV
ncbi:MAG: hypothetical protein V4665_00770 [Patescibacteria group bacterium]